MTPTSEGRRSMLVGLIQVQAPYDAYISTPVTSLAFHLGTRPSTYAEGSSTDLTDGRSII
jgi:hypothetical protein